MFAVNTLLVKIYLVYGIVCCWKGNIRNHVVMLLNSVFLDRTISVVTFMSTAISHIHCKIKN